MKWFLKWFVADFRIVARQHVRLCLSPFVGAVRGVRAEMKRIDAEDAVRLALWKEAVKHAD
jgi:hypothetical protein